MNMDVSIYLGLFFKQCFFNFHVHFIYFFVKFIPKYFILFVAIVNEIFLMSFSDCSLLVYTNTFLYIVLIFCSLAEVVY